MKLRAGLLYTIYTLIFVFPWLRFSQMTYAQSMQFFWLVIAIVPLGLVFLYGLLTGQIQAAHSRFFLFPWLFLISQIISAIFSKLPWHSLWGAPNVQADGLIYILSVMFLGYLIICLQPTKKEIRLLLNLLLLQASLLGLATLSEYLGADSTTGFRAVSPLYNSDYFISYILTILPIGIVGFIYSFNRPFRWINTLGYLTFVIIAGAALYTTLPPDFQSLLQPSQEAPRVSQIKVAYAADTSPIKAALNSSANQERWLLWHLGIKIGNQRPIIGQGPGTFRASFSRLLPTLPQWDYSALPDNPHNDLIEKYAESGILGVITYILMWLALFYLAVRHWHRLDKQLTLGIILGLILFLSFNQALFTTVYTGLIAYVLASLLLVDQVEHKSLLHNYLWSDIALALTALALLYTGYWTWQYKSAEQLAFAGNSYTAQRQVGQAAAQFEEAVKRFPYEENYYRLASANNVYLLAALKNMYAPLSQQNEVNNKAITEADHAIKLNPYNPQNYLIRGAAIYFSSHRSQAQEEEGLQSIYQGIRLSPWDLNNLQAALQAMALRKDTSVAEPIQQQLLDCIPANTAYTNSTIEAYQSYFEAYKPTP